MKNITQFIILICIAQLGAACSSPDFIPINSKANNLEELSTEVNSAPHKEYNILYYSTSYCKPCLKIKDRMDSLAMDQFNKIKLIEIHHENMADSLPKSIWDKYRVRSVPTFIQVDHELSPVNRSGVRNWKKEDAYLDRFIKSIWPEKTPAELLAKKSRKEMGNNRRIFEEALRSDHSFHEVSRLIPSHSYLDQQIARVTGERRQIEEFQDFKVLSQQDYLQTTSMFLRLNSMTADERSQVLVKIPKFKNLQCLELVAGEQIPEQIYELTNLTILKIIIGSGHDMLSDQLVRLQKLEHLSVGYGSIKLPENIGLMSSLKSIDITSESNSQPESLYELANLEYLAIDYEQPKKTDKIMRLKNLIFLRTNYFNPGISELHHLKTLVLIGDKLGDISNLKNLERIDLYNMNDLEVDEKLLSHKSLRAIFIADPLESVKFQESKPANLHMEYFYLSQREEPNVPDYIKEINHFAYYQPY